MVVFTCNHCGESLHKPKVEKHYQFQCRNYKSVTCVDCFKDFRNDEYVAHIKCITEDERYAAKGTFKNGIVKKGEVKQESWVEMIKSICDAEKNLKPSLRQLFETISENSNIPRKKNKFLNFIKSSSGHRANMKEVEEAWDIIEKYKAKNVKHKDVKNDSQTRNEGKIDIQINDERPKKRPNENDSEGSKKKRKMSESTLDIAKEEPANSFDFKAQILDILSKKQIISQKKLQKKILKAYIITTGKNECKEKVIKKLNKKLKKIPNVTIEEDKISLTA